MSKIYVDEIRPKTSGSQVLMPEKPAFLAYINATTDTTINANTNYVFDGVKYNVGSHYNTSNGKFTAPVDGLYNFSFSIYLTNSGSSTGNMSTMIEVNDAEYIGAAALGLARRNPNSSGGTITADLTIPILLSAGDTVNVKSRSEVNRIYQGHSWFSGYLIG